MRERKIRTPVDRFSQALRSVRQKHGLTQEELGTRLQVSQGTISFWENGSETPTVEHVILLALELPELIESFEGYEQALIRKVIQLERELYPGRCACAGCSCQPTSAG